MLFDELFSVSANVNTGRISFTDCIWFWEGNDNASEDFGAPYKIGLLARSFEIVSKYSFSLSALSICSLLSFITSKWTLISIPKMLGLLLGLNSTSNVLAMFLLDLRVG